jgi:hypothetical protein
VICHDIAVPALVTPIGVLIIDLKGKGVNMFWRLLMKIGVDLLISLIVEALLFAIRSVFANFRESQKASFA